MFIRRVKGGSKHKPITYLQLVHSYRDELGLRENSIKVKKAL
ncbi:hypothetical protein [Thermodesulfovibrio aggregans]|nr:hypothetical protein [Thermodesulfovibrio aggregans]